MLMVMLLPYCCQLCARGECCAVVQSVGRSVRSAKNWVEQHAGSAAAGNREWLGLLHHFLVRAFRQADAQSMHALLIML